VEVRKTCNLRPLRLGEERKEERRKKQQGKNIIACPISYGNHNNLPDYRFLEDKLQCHCISTKIMTSQCSKHLRRFSVHVCYVCCASTQGGAFWDRHVTAPHFGVKLPKKTSIWGIAFSSRTCYISTLVYYQNYCIDSNQILHSDKYRGTTKYSSLAVQTCILQIQDGRWLPF